MAVVVQTRVHGVDQATHDRVEQAINANVERAGGPAPGLMVHLGHPDGDGFMVVQVFNNEDAFHAWWADVIAPVLASFGLTTGAHDVRPVWSFARP